MPGGRSKDSPESEERSEGKEARAKHQSEGKTRRTEAVRDSKRKSSRGCTFCRCRKISNRKKKILNV